MKKKPARRAPEPNVFVSSLCNQACVFCSAKDFHMGSDRTMSGREINSVLDRGFETLAIEGGEPLLDKKLELRVARAAARGSREIIVFTNGLLLDAARIKSLLAAGVTKFNFNLPAHTAALHDALCGSKGALSAKIRAISLALRLAPPGAVVLTFVVTALNYETLPAYMRFVAEKLPGVFYVSLNLVKVRGMVAKNTALVPRLSAVEPFLKRALEAAGAAGLRVITDGFPLCFMGGHKNYSLDPKKFMRSDSLYMGEKARSAACRPCLLRRVCAGPRRDYLRLYGAAELRPLRRKGKD